MDHSSDPVQPGSRRQRHGLAVALAFAAAAATAHDLTATERQWLDAAVPVLRYARG